MGDRQHPLLYRATAADAGQLPLPQVVKKLREDLARQWGRLSVWDEVVSYGLRMRVHFSDPADADCLAFGWALMSLSCREPIDAAFDDRYLWACHAVETRLGQPYMQRVKPAVQVAAVLQVVSEVYRDDVEVDEEPPDEPEEPPLQPVPAEAGAEAPRLWEATEDESGVLSLPALVAHLRFGLSVQRPAPVTWADVVALGKKMRFDVARVKPEATDLSYQLWLLAAAWLRYRYPGFKHQDCIAFGRVVVALGYRHANLPPPIDERFAAAYADVQREITDPALSHLTKNSQVWYGVDILVHHYDSGR